MNIVYNASEVASLINKNPYKSQEESVEDVICRIKKQKNTRDINKFNVISKEELVKFLELFRTELLLDEKVYKDIKKSVSKSENKEDISKISKDLFEKVSKKSIEQKTGEKSKEAQKNLETKIDKIMNKKDMKNVKEYVGGFINKQRGIKNEDNIRKTYEKINKSKVTNSNDCLYKKLIFKISDVSFYICGKIDGIENNQLIEIKNRRNHLFTFIPEYEKIQTEIYLRLTGLKEGKLIQNFNETQSSFDLKLDDKLWNFIIKQLKEISYEIIHQL